MYWHDDHDMSGWGWFAMSVGMVLFWVLIVFVAVLLFRALDRSSRERQASPAAPPPAGAAPAEGILAERFARGEIDDEEYRRRLSVLRSGAPPGT
ncbi:SHOCT domain-containing protein [Streptomyces sp. CC210A]|uniref:SHOCT domain-containing protein n=1 Tax=Streptomyces sp. CC210A TaxID=2898184 RepID=UPI001F2F973E|nr:SHOCT domain-containing protein [Streptomyces sp. CC210A]